MFSAGVYTRPIVLTSIRSFSKAGVIILGGVRNLNLQAGAVANNNVGISFVGLASRPIYAVTLSQVSIMQSNQQSIVFSAPTRNCVFAGITIRINFLLTGGFLAPKKISSGVMFIGAAPKLRDTQVIVQAIDPGQFMKITKFAAVFTHTRTPVSNFAFRSDCWNGGYRRPGTQLAGSFRNSRFQFHFSDGVGGDVFNFKSGSASNWLSKNEMAAPSSFWVMVRFPGTLRQFIAANPRSPPQPWPLQYASASRHQVFYVKFGAHLAWRPGVQRTYYLHSYFSDPATRTAKMRCVAYQKANPGMYCVSVAAAPLRNERHRVAVKVINLSRKIIPAGTPFYFGVQIGG